MTKWTQNYLFLFDKLLKTEEKVLILNNKINILEDGNSKIDKLNNKIEFTKEKISKLYLEIQNIIIKDFFDSEFNKIQELEELEHFRRKLYKYSDIIGSTDDYEFFDNYYIEMMNKLEHKCNILENGGIETALKIKHKNPFLMFFKKLFNFKETKKQDSSV